MIRIDGMSLLHSDTELRQWMQAEHGRRMIAKTSQASRILDDDALTMCPPHPVNVGHQGKTLYIPVTTVSIHDTTEASTESYIVLTALLDDSTGDTLSAYLANIYPEVALNPLDQSHWMAFFLIHRLQPTNHQDMVVFLYQIGTVDDYVDLVTQPEPAAVMHALLEDNIT